MIDICYVGAGYVRSLNYAFNSCAVNHSEAQTANRARDVTGKDQSDTRALPLQESTGEIWLTRALLACGIVAPVVIVTLIVTMAARTPGYSHVSDTVSDLAAQGVPDAGIMMAGIFTVGLMIYAFAYGLSRVIVPGGSVVWAALSVFGTAGAVSGLAQDYSEEPGAPRNLEGFLHNTFAIIAVIGLVSAMLLLAWIARWMQGWQRMTKWSVVAAFGVTAGGLTFLVAPESVQGLVQRCIYFFSLTWLVLTALTALRTTFTPVADLRFSSPR
jgi:hypothetical membrane protein